MPPPDPRFEAPIHEEAAETVPVPLAPEELLGVTIADGDERGVVIAVSGEVDLRRTTDLRGIALRLVCECRAVLRPLTAVGLIELFTRCPSVEVALDQPLDG